MSKRGSDTQALTAKRVRSDEMEQQLGLDESHTHQVALSKKHDDDNALIRSVHRTSKLSAPIIKLDGCHTGEITSVKFDMTGNTIVAASADKSVSLWRTYTDNANYGYIPHAHKEAITSLVLSHTSPSDPLILTASADSTIGVWQASTGKLVRRLRGHSDVVNVLAVSRNNLLASAGDDNKVFIWQLDGDDGNGDRTPPKHPVHTITWNAPVIALEWSDDDSTLYIGGLDNQIHAHNLSSHSTLFSLTGHTDTVTFLRHSPCSQHLISCSNDSSVRIWDVKPFTSDPTRQYRVLHGAVSSFEGVYSQPAWSADGTRVAVGSADRTVTVWNVESGDILYKLPGHTGTVGAVDIHPTDPVIVSGGKDCRMFLGELMS
ncbi:hypothetical protein E3P77_03624 [Wallemia ichthyophaga]|nr:hypothetical protein E3P91_03550 [Wallemia ichthyophaga]TIA90715.1 hypothetical protein E3P97_02361 [Wallemia ichthyophaga]TIA95960.1 hypothetical protein E3P95_03475 [Wallemia ichthyophaga]TIA97006.1 hypothetical protein E3P94_03468 [Wallemia ichthyophaga]TIA97603.1 hypothetical protein E3P96_03361 [Wallemia ichthyophaga]